MYWYISLIHLLLALLVLFCTCCDAYISLSGMNNFNWDLFLIFVHPQDEVKYTVYFSYNVIKLTQIDTVTTERNREEESRERVLKKEERGKG